MKKQKPLMGGIVYSTNPTLSLGKDDRPASRDIPNYDQDLRVLINSRLKSGKIATVITGFQGTSESMEQLARTLKGYCGTGGAVKEGVIHIQGDFRDKILSWLIQQGYKAKKSGG